MVFHARTYHIHLSVKKTCTLYNSYLFLFFGNIIENHFVFIKIFNFQQQNKSFICMRIQRYDVIYNVNWYRESIYCYRKLTNLSFQYELTKWKSIRYASLCEWKFKFLFSMEFEKNKKIFKYMYIYTYVLCFIMVYFIYLTIFAFDKHLLNFII